MADTKPGKVIRLSPKLRDFIEDRRIEGETHDACIRRLLALPAKKDRGPFAQRVKFCISSEVHETRAEAKGAAILKAVRSGKKATAIDDKIVELIPK